MNPRKRHLCNYFTIEQKHIPRQEEKGRELHSTSAIARVTAPIEQFPAIEVERKAP